MHLLTNLRELTRGSSLNLMQDFVVICLKFSIACSERRKHCTLAVVRRSQKFSPHCRPHSLGVGQPKFNQLEMVTHYLYPVWWGSMHAISSYHGKGHTHTHPQTGL